jgi:hypothetical protein
MSEESDNVIGDEPAGIAAEPIEGSMNPDDQFAKPRAGRTLPAPATKTAVVAVALPLLKIGNAKADTECSVDLYSEQEVGDPGDCLDCTAVMNPDDCTPSDDPADDPGGDDPGWDYGQD